MYLIGHALVAFLLALGISRQFKLGGISFALIMLITCLPDIDILLQAAGMTSHKTYTHSLILSLVVVPSIIFAISWWRRVSAGAAFVYSLAYTSHIVIGDIAIGGTNILYPFGNVMIGAGVGYGTVEHSAVEFMLLATAAGIIIDKSFRTTAHASDYCSSTSFSSQLFSFDRIDKASYALLLASLVVSFTYLLYGVKVLPRLFIQTNLELALFVMLYLSAIAVISFLIVVARQHKNQQERMVRRSAQ